MVSTGIEMLLFGETRGSRTKRSGNKSYVSYQSYDGRGVTETIPAQQGHGPDTSLTMYYRNPGEAEEVLSSLVDVIDDYDVVTVGESMIWLRCPAISSTINTDGTTYQGLSSKGMSVMGIFSSCPRRKF